MPTPPPPSPDHGDPHGFCLEPPIAVQELQAVAVQGIHLHTGLRVLCLEADDPENVLAICFPTVPVDDTGVPHIAEHVVLGGSAAYPLRDPFVELLRCSMATFANAMTFPDRTVYPVASNVPADFCNLAQVYLDAVFHPLLRRESFLQEGYFLSPSSAPGSRPALREQGIVHSEMRGAYAELETVVQAAVMAQLLPDTPYRYDAGGVPAAIAQLSYEDFLSFCHSHYRADRALVFFYGNLGVPTWLQLLDRALEGLPASLPAPPPQFPGPVPWEAPRQHLLSVTMAPDETPEDRSAVVLAWHIDNAIDLDAHLQMDLLDHLLLGHPGTPLERALTESGLGDDLFLSGYDSERREATFMVGLRGCASSNRQRFRDLVLQTLRRAAAAGLPPDTIRAALNQMEFSRRLIDGQYPVLLAEEALGFWVHGGSPVQAISLEEPLRRLRDRVMDDPQFVPDLIRARLLENPHRLLLAAQPDAALTVAEQGRASERLARIDGDLSDRERHGLREQEERLHSWQETPDSAADLERLPRLRRQQLPKHPPLPTSETEHLGEAILLTNHVFANGLEDCIQAFELPFLPPRLVGLLPLFAYCLGRLDTERGDYASLAARIAELGGRVGAGCCVRRAKPGEGNHPVPMLTIRCSSLGGEFASALDILTEVLLTTRFAPSERLTDLVRQRRSRLLASVLGDGHLIAAQHASEGFSQAHRLRSGWYGPLQLRLADGLANALPGSLASIASDLAEIRLHVLAAGPGILAHTGSRAAAQTLRQHTTTFQAASSAPACPGAPPPTDGAPQPVRSALAVAANGAHVAWCVPAPRFPASTAPLLELGAHLLSLGEAWEEIRAKGGAYGASCEYDAIFGTLSFLSYRDPTPARTLAFFEDLAHRADGFAWSAAQIEEALPAVVRTDQRPRRPPQLTQEALHHHLQGISYADRDTYRQGLLEATPQAVVAALCEALQGGLACVGACALGDPELLAELGRDVPFPTAPLLGERTQDHTKSGL